VDGSRCAALLYSSATFWITGTLAYLTTSIRRFHRARYSGWRMHLYVPCRHRGGAEYRRHSIASVVQYALAAQASACQRAVVAMMAVNSLGDMSSAISTVFGTRRRAD
jgi:hypothetical protein